MIGGSLPLCFLIFNQYIISFCVIKHNHLKEDSSSSEHGSDSGIFFIKQTCTTSLWQLFKIWRYRWTLGGRVLLWIWLKILKVVVTWNFMLQFDRRTASSLLFYYFSFKDISKAKLKEDSSSSEYGSLGVFINQKCKTSSCHFLKIYMKISLNNRRTSPPLNILKILKEVFTWNFIFQLDRMTASSFYNF